MVMDYAELLSYANSSMMCSLILLVGSLVCAFGVSFESMGLTVMAHLSNIVLATVFKFSYIIRLIAQKELGLKLL